MAAGAAVGAAFSAASLLAAGAVLADAGIVTVLASAIGAGGVSAAGADDSARGVTASGSGVLSNTDARRAEEIASIRAVVRKATAVIVVRRARGFVELPEPNIGVLAPPNAAPMSAPRPA